ncbi:DUF2489 domain-containing protein [Ketobacter alkanivorans]|uniref:DUF2489 domain-containing protein n=1 Tax=Ketobacter alkanivorans TaxID=1917421 RepID=A0A2K9LNL9_9GAMM|nr:DUF2489 domain-containing protein [Ketobacter alkanivorans]AUM13938.1 hypothetical protein Kalk_16555 [Ketobacter alkanivorans]MCP5017916.1 DUF2489 domain-containing protein [Ketobacter sp.]
MILLFAALSAVVLVLAGVAAWLWYKVWRNTQQEQQMQGQLQQQQAQTEQNRIDYIHESLNVIACAVLDKQCPVTEGCIRMAVLLDNLPLDCDTKHRFSVVFEVYNATRHIPTHSSWKALGRKQQRKFEQEMLALEREHDTAVMELMAYVKGNPFSRGVGASIN